MDITTMARAAALAAALCAAQTLPRGSALPEAEAAALRALERPGLEELRAGTAGEDVAFGAAERAELDHMQATAGQLEALRGGGLSDRDVRMILIAVGVVLLLVLIF